MVQSDNIALFDKPWAIRHVYYINILTWLRGFRVKIVNLQGFFCPSISQRDLDTKKITPNVGVCPESRDAMLEYWYMELALVFIHYTFQFQNFLCYCTGGNQSDKISFTYIGQCKTQTADCRLQTRGKMKTADSANFLSICRVKPLSASNLNQGYSG